MMKTTMLVVALLALFVPPPSVVASTEELADLLDSREGDIQYARDVIEAEFNRLIKSGEIGVCAYHDIYNPPTGGMVADTRFGDDPDTGTTLKVDTDITVVRVPPGTDKSADGFRAEICSTKPVLNFWKSKFPINETDLLWQYFGGQSTGNIEFFPGFKDLSPDPDYDSRFRPWYSAAATGPKNVVLVIDTSGSMSDANRIGKARNAAKRILQTLTHTDFVSIVAFDDRVRKFPGGTLVRATEENRASIAAWIDDLTAGGGTFFFEAMDATFDLLEASRRQDQVSGCHTAILFLTDGKDGSIGSVLDLMKKRNTADIDARVFTYALGDEAARDKPLEMACQHRGVFTAVGDDDDLENAMAQYYVYFATGIDSDKPRWSELYADAPTGKFITTGALPVYVKRPGKVKELFGVVAIDFKEDALLMNGTLTRQDVNDYLLKRSRDCPDLSLTEEQLVELRGEHQCESALPVWAIILIVFGCFVVVSGICALSFILKRAPH